MPTLWRLIIGRNGKETVIGRVYLNATKVIPTRDREESHTCVERQMRYR